MEASPIPVASSGTLSSNALGGGDALSARNISITRKVNKLLDVDANDQFRQVLQHTEEVCPQLLQGGGELARLRGARLQQAITQPLHQHVLSLHDEFLDQLREIRDVYRLVASDVKELEHVVNDLHTSMAEAAVKAEPLVTAVTVYREELREIRLREAQVKELMGRYNISAEETEVLQNGAIDDVFLRTLLKVRSIHQSCRELLIAEHQQAVIEIMEKMYLLQVHATERLALWLSTRCGEELTGDTPVLSEFFIKCVGVTYDRPAQFMRVINEVSRARRTATIRRFYDLLSKGGNGHHPLDALSNDPVRYIGALLSWIHQTIAEEEDLLRCFFPRNATTNNGTNASSKKRKGEGAEDGAPSAADANADDVNNANNGGNSADFETINIKDVLDQIFEPLCKHFRTRFDQVTDRCVRSAGGAVAGVGGVDLSYAGGGGGGASSSGGGHVMIIFFQLEGILSFYSDTISTLLSPTASLATTVESAKLDTLRVFYNFLQLGTGQMLASVGGGGVGGGAATSSSSSAAGGGGGAFLPKDLCATKEVDNMLRLLKSMLDSMAEGLVPHAKREAEIAPVMGAIVDPLVNLASSGGSSSASSSSFPTSAADEDATVARLVFSVNILAKLQQLLCGYPFTLARANKLKADHASETALLVAASVRRALARTGLKGRCEALEAAKASRGGALTPEEVGAVEAAAKQLYTYVYSVGALPTASIEKIQAIRQRDDILKEVSAVVCATYERLYALVHGSAAATSSPTDVPPAAAAGDTVVVFTSAVDGSPCDAVLKAALCHSPKHMRVLLDVDTMGSGGAVGPEPSL